MEAGIVGFIDKGYMVDAGLGIVGSIDKGCMVGAGLGRGT